MTQDHPFDYAWRKNIQFGKRHRAPEGNHGKAVGQAAAKRHRCAVSGGQVNKIFGKQARTFTQNDSAFGVIRAEGGIQQAVEVKSH